MVLRYVVIIVIIVYKYNMINVRFRIRGWINYIYTYTMPGYRDIVDERSVRPELVQRRPETAQRSVRPDMVQSSMVTRLLI